jgi:hypothetical protein
VLKKFCAKLSQLSIAKPLANIMNNIKELK